jgi:hypothetical protein
MRAAALGSEFVNGSQVEGSFIAQKIQPQSARHIFRKTKFGTAAEKHLVFMAGDRVFVGKRERNRGWN